MTERCHDDWSVVMQTCRCCDSIHVSRSSSIAFTEQSATCTAVHRVSLPEWFVHFSMATGGLSVDIFA